MSIIISYFRLYLNEDAGLADGTASGKQSIRLNAV
jgi:hypothetical protein